MSDKLDCVVLGYYELPLDPMLQMAKDLEEVSGGYSHLKANTVPFGGKRIRYHDLFNRCIEAATDKPSQYHVGKLPNLGACYLASFLRKRSFQAEVVNFFNSDQERLRQLLAQKPNAVAITTTFYFDSQPVSDMIDFIRRYDDRTTIIVGGPYIYNLCSDHSPQIQEYILSTIGADVYVFDSQGELTLSHLCAELRNPHPNFDAIPNLIYTDDHKTFHRTPRQVEDNDMNRDAIDWRYFDRDFLVPTVQTRTARSCAYKCSFCRYPVMAGALALADLETIEQELNYLCSMGVTNLLFIDDTFNIPKQRFKDICRLMIRNKYNFNWLSYFRCANADDEAFELAAKSGCTSVFLGIESGDNSILKAMNKGATANKYRYGIKKFNEYNIMTYASFIVGFPGETEKTAYNTFDFIEETQPTFYSLEGYFHDQKVPVAEKSDLFGLQGNGYSWAHNTMDWRESAELVKEGYRRVTNSLILPLQSFDLWTVGYLMGEGIKREQITRFLKSAGDMLIDGLDNEDSSLIKGEEQLLSIFRESSI